MNMNNKFRIILLLGITINLNTFNSYSQSVETGKLYITIDKSSRFLQIKDYLDLRRLGTKLNEINIDTTINRLINVYQINTLDKVCDITTGVNKLDNWYVLSFSGSTKNLLDDLKSQSSLNISDIEFVPKMFPLAASNDYYEPNLTPQIENRALNLINASRAWNIRSSNTVKIAVSGEYGYKQHEDLVTNIEYNEVPFVNNSSAFHGTAAAGFAGGVSNNNLGIASAGFNPKVLVYSSYLDYNMSALIDAINRGVKIVTMSYGSISYSSYMQSVIDYGYNQGVTFVAGAGNGKNWEYHFSTTPITCDKNNALDNLAVTGNSECLAYPASLNHVISATAVAHLNPYGVPFYLNEPTAGYPSGYYNWNWKDLHEEISNDASTTFTHNPKVDICAPGYFSPGLNWDDANKYIACYGTSFSSPMVASALSLLLSINPCLTPDDLEFLIKATAFNVYSIQENQKYTGKLGAGRLDLFAAATLAEKYKAKIIQNTTLSTSLQSGHSILIGSNISNTYPFGNVTINSGQNVNFMARQLIEIQKGFEALSGSEFTLNVDDNYNPCQ
jgi:hypothetical protein